MDFSKYSIDNNGKKEQLKEIKHGVRKNQIDKKFQNLFSIYDKNDNGTLEFEDLLRIFESLQTFSKANGNIEDFVLDNKENNMVKSEILKKCKIPDADFMGFLKSVSDASDEIAYSTTRNIDLDKKEILTVYKDLSSEKITYDKSGNYLEKTTSEDCLNVKYKYEVYCNGKILLFTEDEYKNLKEMGLNEIIEIGGDDEIKLTRTAEKVDCTRIIVSPKQFVSNLGLTANIEVSKKIAERFEMLPEEAKVIIGDGYELKEMIEKQKLEKSFDNISTVMEFMYGITLRTDKELKETEKQREELAIQARNVQLLADIFEMFSQWNAERSENSNLVFQVQEFFINLLRNITITVGGNDDIPIARTCSEYAEKFHILSQHLQNIALNPKEFKSYFSWSFDGQEYKPELFEKFFELTKKGPILDENNNLRPDIVKSLTEITGQPIFVIDNPNNNTAQNIAFESLEIVLMLVALGEVETVKIVKKVGGKLLEAFRGLGLGIAAKQVKNKVYQGALRFIGQGTKLLGPMIKEGAKLGAYTFSEQTTSNVIISSLKSESGSDFLDNFVEREGKVLKNAKGSLMVGAFFGWFGPTVTQKVMAFADRVAPKIESKLAEKFAQKESLEAGEVYEMMMEEYIPTLKGRIAGFLTDVCGFTAFDATLLQSLEDCPIGEEESLLERFIGNFCSFGQIQLAAMGIRASKQARMTTQKPYMGNESVKRFKDLPQFKGIKVKRNNQGCILETGKGNKIECNNTKEMIESLTFIARGETAFSSKFNTGIVAAKPSTQNLPQIKLTDFRRKIVENKVLSNVYTQENGNNLYEIKTGLNNYDYYEFDKNGNIISFAENYSKSDFKENYDKYKNQKPEEYGYKPVILGINAIAVFSSDDNYEAANNMKKNLLNNTSNEYSKKLENLRNYQNSQAFTESEISEFIEWAEQKNDLSLIDKFIKNYNPDKIRLYGDPKNLLNAFKMQPEFVIKISNNKILDCSNIYEITEKVKNFEASLLDDFAKIINYKDSNGKYVYELYDIQSILEFLEVNPDVKVFEILKSEDNKDGLTIMQLKRIFDQEVRIHDVDDDDGQNNGRIDTRRSEKYTRILNNPKTRNWAIKNWKAGFSMDEISSLVQTQQNFYTNAKPTISTNESINSDVQDFMNYGLEKTQAEHIIKAISNNDIIDEAMKNAAIKLINQGYDKSKIAEVLEIAKLSGEFNPKIVDESIAIKDCNINPLLKKYLPALNNLKSSDIITKFSKNLKKQIQNFIEKLLSEDKFTLSLKGIDVESITNKLNAKIQKSTDVITPGKKKTNYNIRSKSSIKGFERLIVDKYKLDETIWVNSADTKKWAEDKYLEYKNKQYVSTRTGEFVDTERVNRIRETALKEWFSFIESEQEIKYNPFIKVVLAEFITKDLLPNNSSTPPILNRNVVKSTLLEMATLNNGTSFEKLYNNAISKIVRQNGDAREVTFNGMKMKWYVVPKSSPNSANYQENVARVRALSEGTNWCIRTWKTEDYIQKGDIHFLVDENGMTRLCLREEGEDYIKEIQQRHQNAAIPPQYIPFIDEFLAQKDYDIDDRSLQRIEYRRSSQRAFLTEQKQIKQLVEQKDYKALLERLGIEVKVLPDGTWEISHYKTTEMNLCGFIGDYGINENELLKNVSIIRGDADFNDSNATSLPNLKEVRGKMKASCSKISNLKGLQRINGRPIIWE